MQTINGSNKEKRMTILGWTPEEFKDWLNLRSEYEILDIGLNKDVGRILMLIEGENCFQVAPGVDVPIDYPKKNGRYVRNDAEVKHD